MVKIYKNNNNTATNSIIAITQFHTKQTFNLYLLIKLYDYCNFNSL